MIMVIILQSELCWNKSTGQPVCVFRSIDFQRGCFGSLPVACEKIPTHKKYWGVKITLRTRNVQLLLKWRTFRKGKLLFVQFAEVEMGAPGSAELLNQKCIHLQFFIFNKRIATRWMRRHCNFYFKTHTFLFPPRIIQRVWCEEENKPVFIINSANSLFWWVQMESWRLRVQKITKSEEQHLNQTFFFCFKLDPGGCCCCWW